VRETGGLRDTVEPYNQETGKGNGFTFANYNAHDMFATINQGIALFKNKTEWHKIVTNAMKSDYSWKHSAKQYKEIYKKMIE